MRQFYEGDEKDLENGIMKIKIIIIRVIMLMLILVYAPSFGFGQHSKSSDSKKLWSPPDKSFTVIVPAKLKNTKEYDNGSDPSGYTSIRTYRGMTSNYAFLVLILKLGKDTRNRNLKEKFDGLEFVIGGDDDYDFTEKYLKIDGLDAKEIVYTNLRAKGLMIDAGNTVYVLALGAFNRKDLDSEVAKYFFTSFHLLQSL